MYYYYYYYYYYYCRCSVALESASSWYWTEVSSTDTDPYVVQTGFVPAFKLYSSSVVYLHCNLQLCLVSEVCEQKTEVRNIQSHSAFCRHLKT